MAIYAGRATYRAWSTVTLRWADDDIYGHVNNTVYYQWFDSAVNQWLIDAGLLEPGGGAVIALVASTSCNYRAPLAFPGEAEIGLAVARLGASSITYRIGVFAPGREDPAAQGRFVHVCVDGKTRRPIAIPDPWRAALAPLICD